MQPGTEISTPAILRRLTRQGENAILRCTRRGAVVVYLLRFCRLHDLCAVCLKKDAVSGAYAVAPDVGQGGYSRPTPFRMVRTTGTRVSQVEAVSLPGMDLNSGQTLGGGQEVFPDPGVIPPVMAMESPVGASSDVTPSAGVGGDDDRPRVKDSSL